MTISIRIKNADSREKAVVRVNRVHKRKKSLLPVVESTDKFLKGGEELTEYVYDGQSLIIEEVENG